MADAEELSPREAAILGGIVAEYIDTGAPVGSAALARAMKCSSATIRNTMARLVERRLLVQPHVSAGRVPTLGALRIYVERLLEPVPVGPDAHSALKSSLETGLATSTRLEQAAGRTLGDVTSLVGIASPLRLSQVRFRHIDFVQLTSNRIIVIWVDDAANVYNQVVKLETETRPAELQQVANYLNEVHTDSTFAEVRKRLEEAIDADEAYVALARKAAELWRSAFEVDETQDVFVERPTNLVALDAFSDPLRLRNALDALQEKKLLLDIIQNLEGTSTTQVFVGLEHKNDALEQCSLIVAPYGNRPGEPALGWVGVVGPTRISYRVVIPVVECIAKEVSQVLSEESAA